MVNKTKKAKTKDRPPRIFIKGNKLFVQIGKKKILLKDADKFKKADILNILLTQLLIRRKRRAKGKMTRKEKKLNSEDLRIFNEFENMNRNQTKGTLKIPEIPSKKKNMNFRDVLFYNGILHFMKSLPKKDINVEIQEDIKKEKKKATEGEKKTTALVPAAPAAPDAPDAPAAPPPYVTMIQNAETPKFTDAQYETLQQELGYTKKQLGATKQAALFAVDLLNYEKKVKDKTSKKKGMLKKWKEEVEKKYNVKINVNFRTSFTDYVVKIAQAYPGAISNDEFAADYYKIRNKLFDIREEKEPEEKEEKEVKEVKEPEVKEPESTDETSSSGSPYIEYDDATETDYIEFEDATETDDMPEIAPDQAAQFTDPADNPDDNPELAAAATAVLDQVARGSSYSGKGLSTQEIDDMMKPILDFMYLGTLPLDFNKFLPSKLNSKRMGFIMNTDPSNKEGKHWVSILIDLTDDMSVEYFDSFGREPPKKFMKEIKKLIDRLKPNSYLKFKTNRVQVQDKSTQNCGFFAMKFLLDRLSNGLSFKEATGYKPQIIDNSIEGENNIQLIKNKFGYI
jgi:hypothetical protein